MKEIDDNSVAEDIRGINKKLDSLISVVTAHDEKIERLISVVATHDDINRLDDRIDKLEEKVERLVSSVDSLAKSYDDLRIEYVAIKSQLSRYERWFEEISKKTGIKLEY